MTKKTESTESTEENVREENTNTSNTASNSGTKTDTQIDVIRPGDDKKKISNGKDFSK
jgi:hypothetical protein